MDLKPLFEPKSLAVVGVSLHNDLHPSNIIFYKNLYRYPVEAYPVNPKAGVLKGVAAYSSVRDLPEVVDLAIISARAEAVPGILEDCVTTGVKAGAIISGGFAEVGNNDLQRQIVSIARSGLPFIGPELSWHLFAVAYDSFLLRPDAWCASTGKWRYQPSEAAVRPDDGFRGGVGLPWQSASDKG